NGTVLGNLSANTVSAIRISAEQINAGKIRADMVDATNLSAISANLGNITSGNINISESISIGASINMRGSSRTGIYFNSWSQIFDQGGALQIEGYNGID